MFNKKSTYLVILITLIITISFTFTFSEAAFAKEDVEYVYLGGTPIGVVAKLNGAMVIDIVDVTTEHGGISPAARAGILKGDIILSINGVEIKSADTITNIVDKTQGNFLNIQLIRNDERLSVLAKPEIDLVINKYKLGILVKNDVAGVGTLTYIRTDNKRYAGLGHKIIDPLSTSKDIYNQGNIYDCNIIGSVKGTPGNTGELRGLFSRKSNSLGTIDKNIFCGIYGDYKDKDFNGKEKVKLGTMKNVKPGKAKIYTTVKGSKPELYDIEIVKCAKQNSPEEKSMVIHVTDEKLIKETGGIVQGMSGSPIIQDGVLIGAVTHVFLNDPTRGFGIYIDWMINN